MNSGILLRLLLLTFKTINCDSFEIQSGNCSKLFAEITSSFNPEIDEILSGNLLSPLPARMSDFSLRRFPMFSATVLVELPHILNSSSDVARPIHSGQYFKL